MSGLKLKDILGIKYKGWVVVDDGDVYGPYEEEGEAKKKELQLKYEEHFGCRRCRGL